MRAPEKMTSAGSVSSSVYAVPKYSSLKLMPSSFDAPYPCHSWTPSCRRPILSLPTCSFVSAATTSRSLSVQLASRHRCAPIIYYVRFCSSVYQLLLFETPRSISVVVVTQRWLQFVIAKKGHTRESLISYRLLRRY